MEILQMVRKLDDAMVRRQEIMQHRAEQLHGLNRELASLAQTKGWIYAQHVANNICNEFRCTPNDAGWQTYTTMQYAFQRLFEYVKTLNTPPAKLASAPKAQSITEQIQAEIKEKYGRSRGDDDEGSASSGRRQRRSK